MLYLILVFFAGLFVFHFLERLAPIKTDYKTGPTRRGYLADLIASIVNGPVLSGGTKIVATWIVLWFPPLGITGMSTWSWAQQFAVFLLLNDFGRYWLHRWYHTSPILWRAHRVHHTVVKMDALSTFRVHVLEALIKYGVIVLPFHLLHVDQSVILFYTSIDLLKGLWHHANVRTSIGPFNYIFNSAELHWWHHSTRAKGQRANYSSIFSIWDLLFGTLYYDRGKWPETIGVKGLEDFPDTYHELLTSIRHDDDAALEAYRKVPASTQKEQSAQPREGAAEKMAADRPGKRALSETVHAVERHIDRPGGVDARISALGT